MTNYVAVWPDGIRVRFRPLTGAEYRKFRYKMLTSPAGVSLEVYQAVALDGPDLDHLPAGIARFIADDLFRNSPFNGSFSTIEAALVKSRAHLGVTYLLSAQALISHVFRYSLEEIDSWDPDMFFERLAMAEFILGKPLDPVRPVPAQPQAKSLWDQEKQQRVEPRPKQPLNSRQIAALQRTRKSRSGG